MSSTRRCVPCTPAVHRCREKFTEPVRAWPDPATSLRRATWASLVHSDAGKSFTCATVNFETTSEFKRLKFTGLLCPLEDTLLFSLFFPLTWKLYFKSWFLQYLRLFLQYPKYRLTCPEHLLKVCVSQSLSGCTAFQCRYSVWIFFASLNKVIRINFC